MAKLPQEELSRRERQAMDVLHRHGQATAQEVMEALPDQPTYSAVRSLLSVLVEKGWAKHTRQSRKYVYKPTEAPQRARKSAVQRLLGTFFGGSPERLVASLLDPAEGRLSGEEVSRIRALLEEHDKRGGAA